MRMVWLLLGFISLALGVIGAFLPLLPTVPLVLLAAFFFSKSSERLHNWLLSHKVFGPMISEWRSSGSIRRPVKIYATLSIIAAFCLPFFLGLKPVIIVIQAIVLSCVTIFIWTRPEA